MFGICSSKQDPGCFLDLMLCPVGLGKLWLFRKVSQKMIRRVHVDSAQHSVSERFLEETLPPWEGSEVKQSPVWLKIIRIR